MQEISACHARKQRPIRVLQYGEGNFLRAFVDYMIDIANEKGLFDGDVAIVKPISYGSLDMFNRQDNLYTVCLRGKAGGQVIRENRAVTCVGRAVDAYGDYEAYMALAELDTLEFIVSNTTEAGIVYDACEDFAACPPNTYPGKLTQFLFRRFGYFQGAADKGLIILPVELIENNGGKLKECVLGLIDTWKLPDAFRVWVEESCVFCSTLVDRIVTGYPKDTVSDYWAELGYEDRLLAVCEPFALWVIESGRNISPKLPLDKAGLPVVFTQDQRPYRERKVRLLNGAHTATVLAAYLMGMDIVGECMADPDIRKYVRGGAVLGHVRWGETVYSPIVPEGRVDYLVAFEQLEALRHLGQVKSSGTILVNQQKIYPVLVSSGLAEYPSDEVIETSLNRTAKAIYKIPAVDLALGIGNSKVLNIVLLGALSSLFDIEAAVWEKVLEERVPKKFTELNIQAFREGRNWMKGK